VGDGEVNKAVPWRVDDGVADECVSQRGDRLRRASQPTCDGGAGLGPVTEVGHRRDVEPLGVGQTSDTALEEVFVEVVIDKTERRLGVRGGDARLSALSSEYD
jgi:hypothetical protein